MIDQELAKNILNNLLDVTVSKQGSQEERDNILASNYVTDRSETAPLKTIVQTLEVDMAKSTLDGGCNNGFSLSESSPYSIGDLGKISASSINVVPTMVQNAIDNVKNKYKTVDSSDIVYVTRGINCFLPITSVTPAVAPGSEEESFPIGFSTENLEDYISPLNSIEFIGISEITNEGPASSKGFKGLSTFITSRRSNIISILAGSSFYGNSGSKNFYTYETIGGASQAKEITVSKTFTYRQWEKRKQKHYFKVTWINKVGTSEYSKTENFECEYQYYQLSDPISVSVTFKGWYYPQTFSTLSYYPSKAYLGLFTDYKLTEDGKNENGMPNADGTKFREPPYKNGAEYTYQRMSLHRGLFSDEYVFNEIDQNSLEALEHAGYAHISNKEIIMFPEILNEEGWGNIYGFGIFENEVPVEGEKPYFWGYVDGAPSNPVSTSKKHVPLFRPNQFEVFLG